jgi:ferrous iron transport protein A
MELPEKNPGGIPDGDTLTTLDRILPPSTCHVSSVLARGPIRQRLMAFGFVPGTVVEAVRAAPLGDPVEYKVKGCCISLRREDARLISVTGRREG